MKVTLYSTNCPKCHVLEKKLTNKNIDFNVVTDENIMLEKGFMSAPMLEVDDNIMDFKEGNIWINSYGK